MSVLTTGRNSPTGPSFLESIKHLTLPTASLLPADFQDPQLARFASVGNDIAIALCGVVEVADKRKNLANNEDAASCFLDENARIRMISIADMHNGYVAAQESVLIFPDCVVQSLEQRQSDEQMILNAVMSLCCRVDGIGRKSGVTYNIRDFDGYTEAIPDCSVGQFFSVIDLDGKFYLVGLGDCSCNIIRGDTVINVETQNLNNGFVGSLTPNVMMKECHSGSGLRLDDPMPFNSPRVRKGIDVIRLPVISGDIILLSSDGFAPALSDQSSFINSFYPKVTAAEFVRSTIENVRGAGKTIYSDNVAIAAIKV